jgi:arylsulfatase A-like enzyme
MVAHLDVQIGRILDALDRSDAAEHTWVIFAGDNGLALGSHGLMGKQNLYEHSTRVPLIIRGPNLPRGRTSPALVYLFDLFPTICQAAGVPVPPEVEGRSLLPLLRGEASTVRDSLFTAYRNSQRAIRDERWKLIRYPLVDRTQLFDLRRDPFETRDLSGSPKYASQQAALLNELRHAQAQLSDPAPLTVPVPKPAAWSPPRPPH